MLGVPTVRLADLTLSETLIAGPAYTTAAEAIAVGLSRYNAVVLRLGDGSHTSMLAACLVEGLCELLSGEREIRSLPGCELREWRVGGAPAASDIEVAYGILESAARTVLHALCRSSLLRLRSDAFSGLMDDLPLSRGSRGSSVLCGKQYLDNFSALPPEDSAAVLPLFADPQDAVTERGLVSLFYCKEARDSSGGAVSAMQVQDSRGAWQDIKAGPNDLVVLVGHSMQHATAGLLRASVHRLVGTPFQPAAARRISSSGSTDAAQARTELHFELRPRPSAVLDLRPQLEAAGHAVSSRFSPMSVSSLLEQFECLMSPAAKLATPDQQQGAAVHAAWEELQATLKKGKKRGSHAAHSEVRSDAALPVTRSGRVRRSSAEALSAANQQQQPRGQAAGKASGQKENAAGGHGMDWERGSGAAAGARAQRRRSDGAGQRQGSAGGAAVAAGSIGGFSLGSAASGGRRASLEPAATSAALVIVRGRTCSVLEGCLADDPADCLTVCVRSFTGVERWFYCSKAIRCGAIFEMFCARLGIGLGAVKFLLRGERVFGASTPESLKMRDGDELTAVPESSDRLLQQRELGPLFSAVFGADVPEAVDDLPQILI